MTTKAQAVAAVNQVGHGVTVENVNGSKIVYGEDNKGVGYSGSKTGTGEYSLTDTNSNQYKASYNAESGEWDATKTTKSGNEYSGSFLVEGTGNNNLIVYDPNKDGWTLTTTNGSNTTTNTGDNSNYTNDTNANTSSSNTANSSYFNTDLFDPNLFSYDPYAFSYYPYLYSPYSYNSNLSSSDSSYKVGSGYKIDYTLGDAVSYGTDLGGNNYQGIKMGPGYWLIDDSRGNTYTARNTGGNNWYVIKYDMFGRMYEGDFETVTLGNGQFDVLDSDQDKFKPMYSWL